jgi:hypothetical protein
MVIDDHHRPLLRRAGFHLSPSLLGADSKMTR